MVSYDKTITIVSFHVSIISIITTVLERGRRGEEWGGERGSTYIEGGSALDVHGLMTAYNG